MTTEERIIRALKKQWDWSLAIASYHVSAALVALSRPAQETIAALCVAVLWTFVGIARRGFQ